MQSCIQSDKQEGVTPSEIMFALSEKSIEFSISVLYDVILRHSLTQLVSQRTVDYAKAKEDYVLIRMSDGKMSIATLRLHRSKKIVFMKQKSIFRFLHD